MEKSESPEDTEAARRLGRHQLRSEARMEKGKSPKSAEQKTKEQILTAMSSLSLPERWWLLTESPFETEPVFAPGYRWKVWSVNEYTRAHKGFEPEVTSWIESIEPDSVLWDVGANIGAFTLHAACVLKERVTIVAIEPAYTNYTALVTTIVTNHLQRIVTPLPVALANETGLFDLHYSDLSVGSALHAIMENIDHKREIFEPAATVKTMTYKARDLIERFLLPRPNYLKIDVDGKEKLILEGLGPFLGSAGLRSLLVEAVEISENDPIISELEQLVGAYGLKLERKILHKKYVERYPKIYDVIFGR